MKFKVYTQLENGEVYVLKIKPLISRDMARNAVQAAKCRVLEVGERCLMDCIEKTTRATYRASLGQNSIWYERIDK